MNLSPGVLRAIALLQAGLVPLGCWTVCNETEDVKEAYAIDVEREPGGRLVELGGLRRTFTSCNEVCEAQGGLIELKSCKVSVRPRDASAPMRESVTVFCDGLWASCRTVPTVIGSGRAPEGYASPTSGAYLAECARMESAAATAFDRLARELADHGAPAALVTAAWQAADDEKHHARLMGTVAEEFGETAVFYDAAPLPLRPLLAVALENAREGVVHETFGAVLNAHQSEHAESARLRACYAAIAEDELAHARLSLEVHAWALTRLNSSERAQVISEVTSAVAAVGAQVATTRDRDPRFGLPAREATREILASLSEKVWSTCV